MLSMLLKETTAPFRTGNRRRKDKCQIGSQFWQVAMKAFPVGFR